MCRPRISSPCNASRRGACRLRSSRSTAGSTFGSAADTTVRQRTRRLVPGRAGQVRGTVVSSLNAAPRSAARLDRRAPLRPGRAAANHPPDLAQPPQLLRLRTRAATWSPASLRTTRHEPHADGCHPARRARNRRACQLARAPAARARPPAAGSLARHPGDRDRGGHPHARPSGEPAHRASLKGRGLP